ncbi:hypothetical protein BVRB_1g004300 [Beta vulgaris subsp. vulgaris]|nr:hypothetical protein BVRB_1g004300 [Beta vulgaris subsp. vulgaris]
MLVLCLCFVVRSIFSCNLSYNGACPKHLHAYPCHSS